MQQSPTISIIMAAYNRSVPMRYAIEFRAA